MVPSIPQDGRDTSPRTGLSYESSLRDSILEARLKIDLTRSFAQRPIAARRVPRAIFLGAGEIETSKEPVMSTVIKTQRAQPKEFHHPRFGGQRSLKDKALR
jgi:hypothetical protein